MTRETKTPRSPAGYRKGDITSKQKKNKKARGASGRDSGTESGGDDADASLRRRDAISSPGNDGYYQHQRGGLGCGRMALNNLLGATVFIKGTVATRSRPMSLTERENLNAYSQVDLMRLCALFYNELSHHGVPSDVALEKFCNAKENMDGELLLAALGTVGYRSDRITTTSVPQHKVEELQRTFSIDKLWGSRALATNYMNLDNTIASLLFPDDPIETPVMTDPELDAENTVTGYLIHIPPSEEEDGDGHWVSIRHLIQDGEHLYREVDSLDCSEEKSPLFTFEDLCEYLQEGMDAEVSWRVFEISWQNERTPLVSLQNKPRAQPNLEQSRMDYFLALELPGIPM